MTSLPPQMNRADLSLMTPLPEKRVLADEGVRPPCDVLGFETSCFPNPDGSMTRSASKPWPKPPLGPRRYSQTTIQLRTHDSTKATSWRVSDSANDAQQSFNKDYPAGLAIGCDLGALQGDVTVVARRIVCESKEDIHRHWQDGQNRKMTERLANMPCNNPAEISFVEKHLNKTEVGMPKLIFEEFSMDDMRKELLAAAKRGLGLRHISSYMLVRFGTKHTDWLSQNDRRTLVSYLRSTLPAAEKPTPTASPYPHHDEEGKPITGVFDNIRTQWREQWKDGRCVQRLAPAERLEGSLTIGFGFFPDLPCPF